MIALPLAVLLQTAATAPPLVQNARVTTREVAPGTLSAEVSRLAGQAGPRWIGYSQPAVEGKRRMCCFDSPDHARRGSDRMCCGGCALERDQSFTIGYDDERAIELEGSPRLVVLLRADAGRIGKIRALDDRCGIDAGGLPLHWLTGVRPEESVALLASIARELDRHDTREDHAGSALAALALTGDPSADASLEAMLAAREPREIRKAAAFWTGNARGRRGFELLRAIVPGDPDADFRREGTFAISQSPLKEATDLLIAMAKRDRDGEVRGQALFWLAEKAADRAAETIQNAIRDDPDEEVKKKAVFALSQLHTDEAVTELIRVARTNRNAEVRRQAVFWLGQSRDPRALAFIEEVLEH